MPKASPAIRSFNGGEFSELMEGRTDLERYPASARQMRNAIAAPQGPFISRSGTSFTAPAAYHDRVSVLSPFIYSEEQAQMLELADDRIRFVNEEGLQTYTPVDTVTSSTSPFQITSALLGANIGDQVALSGYPVSYNLNGEIAYITDKAGDLYTLDKTFPALASANGKAARVYHVALTFTEAQRKVLWAISSPNVLYFLTGARIKKLSRYGTYDWRLEDEAFTDGPYLPINDTATKFTLSGTGNGVPNMTTNTLPSGTASGSGNHPGLAYDEEDDSDYSGERDPVTARRLHYDLPASDYYKGFSANDEEYWASNAIQGGTLQYQASAAFIADGYTIYAAKANQDPDYLSKDYAPSTWKFDGSNDGVSWTTLDEQVDFVAYASSKSTYFKLKDNETAYNRYRIVVTKLMRNGEIECRIRRLVISSKTGRTLTLTASGTAGINRDLGFQATDVNRHIRLKAADNTWRWFKIKAVTNTTVCTVELQDEPLPSTKAISQWRLGYWSDTTGWPICGVYFEDRLTLGGPSEYPDMIGLSVSGEYENFAPTDATGQVLDESGIAVRLNTPRVSSIRWLEVDEKGLLIGSGSGEYILASSKGELESLTGRNLKSRSSTSRGSARVRPVKIDRQILYVQRSGRTLRELAFVYDADGYRSPSMSQLASHLGVKKFVEMDYAAEPHGIVWVRREDGTVVGLTYNRDENVIGWHQHDYSGVVESLAVLPKKDQSQDTLWMIIRRTINGQTRRYIEQLTRFWDFDIEKQDAWLVDSGLQYSGSLAQDIYGLQHLEGQVVYGLADGVPIGPFTVTNGHVQLAAPASKVTLGLGYESLVEISRMENGAADGTAIGKSKRIHNTSLLVWRSHGGKIGVRDIEKIGDDGKLGGMSYTPVEYPRRADELESTDLYTGEVGPSEMPPSNDKRGTLTFVREKKDTLPFNVMMVMPQLYTQDR